MLAAPGPVGVPRVSSVADTPPTSPGPAPGRGRGPGGDEEVCLGQPRGQPGAAQLQEEQQPHPRLS